MSDNTEIVFPKAQRTAPVCDVTAGDFFMYGGTLFMKLDPSVNFNYKNACRMDGVLVSITGGAIVKPVRVKVLVSDLRKEQ